VPRQARLWIDVAKTVVQLVLPPHADVLEELLIVAEIRQFFFGTILQDLRKQHESGWASPATNEFSQRCQENWIRKLIILHPKPAALLQQIDLLAVAC